MTVRSESKQPIHDRANWHPGDRVTAMSEMSDDLVLIREGGERYQSVLDQLSWREQFAWGYRRPPAVWDVGLLTAMRQGRIVRRTSQSVGYLYAIPFFLVWVGLTLGRSPTSEGSPRLAFALMAILTISLALGGPGFERLLWARTRQLLGRAARAAKD